MSLVPAPEANVHLIRGDTWRMTVGLSDFPEVIAAPEDYVIKWVFRVDQNDNLANLLELDGTWYDPSAGEDPDVEILADFVGTPAETSSLPPYNIVYFCEIRDLAGNVIERLVQGDVEVDD